MVLVSNCVCGRGGAVRYVTDALAAEAIVLD